MVLVFHDAIKSHGENAVRLLPNEYAILMSAIRSSLDRALQYEFIYQNIVAPVVVSISYYRRPRRQ